MTNLIKGTKYQWNYNGEIKMGDFIEIDDRGFANFATIEGERWLLYLPDSPEYNLKEVKHD